MRAILKDRPEGRVDRGIRIGLNDLHQDLPSHPGRLFNSKEVVVHTYGLDRHACVDQIVVNPSLPSLPGSLAGGHRTCRHRPIDRLSPQAVASTSSSRTGGFF